MINELTKAVLDKHGPLLLSVDRIGKYSLSKLGKYSDKTTPMTFSDYSLESCLIRMLAEDKE